jgi:PPOX class probable F420-dependent enzyme
LSRSLARHPIETAADDENTRTGKLARVDPEELSRPPAIRKPATSGPTRHRQQPTTKEHSMAQTLSNAARDLINRPIIASVATVSHDDKPQLTPVWIDLDGNDLVFNTAKGRAKQANLERNPHVAVSVVDPDNAYNVVVVRGVAESTEEGADEHIDALAKKYLGVDTYPMRQPGEVRLKYRVRAEHIVMQPADES